MKRNPAPALSVILSVTLCTISLCALSALFILASFAQDSTSPKTNDVKPEVKSEAKSEKTQTTKMPTVTINGQEIKLEIAQTREAIEKGLMFRTSLAADSGMVFLFNPPRPVNFWMYNTLIHLDMLFVREGKIVKIFENVPPGPSKDYQKCPTYPSGDGILVNQVIEVEGGYCQKKGIKEGDTVQFSLK